MVTRIFLLKPNQKSLYNSLEEINWSKRLSDDISKKYLCTRSETRLMLSNIFNIHPLDIPLKAPPSRLPILERNLGYISISHSRDILLLAWSTNKIGIDLEDSRRKINPLKISKRFFLPSEDNIIRKKNIYSQKNFVLKLFTIKEACVKLEGKGLAKNMNNWIWDGSDLVLNSENSKKAKVFSFDYKFFKISIAQDRTSNDLPLVCTFF